MRSWEVRGCLGCRPAADVHREQARADLTVKEKGHWYGPGSGVLLLVPRLPAVAKGLFLFPRWRGRCHVSLHLASSAIASTHSSDLDLLPPPGLGTQTRSSLLPSPNPPAPLASPGSELPRSWLPEVRAAEISDRGHGVMGDPSSDKNFHGCPIPEIHRLSFPGEARLGAHPCVLSFPPPSQSLGDAGMPGAQCENHRAANSTF